MQISVRITEEAEVLQCHSRTVAECKIDEEDRMAMYNS